MQAQEEVIITYVVPEREFYRQHPYSELNPNDITTVLDDASLLSSNGYKITIRMLVLPFPEPDWDGSFKSVHEPYSGRL